jgi:hypothetical protein
MPKATSSISRSTRVMGVLLALIGIITVVQERASLGGRHHTGSEAQLYGLSLFLVGLFLLFYRPKKKEPIQLPETTRGK